MKKCEKCGQQIEDKAVVCIHCGCSVKKKKAIFKKWWFWAVIAILVVAIIAGSGGGDENDPADHGDQQTNITTDTTQNAEEAQGNYELIDLQTMVDDLDSNAMRAEEKYLNKQIEITGKIANIDSDGSYISIDPVNSDFNLTSVMCYIKNDAQKAIIMDKSKDDTITIRGKVKSIGEILGYSIDIKEIVK